MDHHDGRELMALHGRSLRLGTAEPRGNVAGVEAVARTGRVHDRVEFYEWQARACTFVQNPDFLASGLEDGLFGAQMRQALKPMPRTGAIATRFSRV